MGTARYCGRSPHGERGLKPARRLQVDIARRRSPHGEHGLKQVRRSLKFTGRSINQPYSQIYLLINLR